MIHSPIRHPSGPIYPEPINTEPEYTIDRPQSPRIVGSVALTQTPESARPDQQAATTQGPTELPISPSDEFIDPTRTPATGQISTGDPGFPK